MLAAIGFGFPTMIVDRCLNKERKRQYEVVRSTLASLAACGLSGSPPAQGPALQAVLPCLLVASTLFYNTLFRLQTESKKSSRETYPLLTITVAQPP